MSVVNGFSVILNKNQNEMNKQWTIFEHNAKTMCVFVFGYLCVCFFFLFQSNDILINDFQYYLRLNFIENKTKKIYCFFFMFTFLHTCVSLLFFFSILFAAEILMKKLDKLFWFYSTESTTLVAVCNERLEWFSMWLSFSPTEWRSCVFSTTSKS